MDFEIRDRAALEALIRTHVHPRGRLEGEYVMVTSAHANPAYDWRAGYLAVDHDPIEPAVIIVDTQGDSDEIVSYPPTSVIVVIPRGKTLP